MIKMVKEKIVAAPTPLAGLALGIASLGWSWEYFIDFNGYTKQIAALIAGILLLFLLIKFLLHNHLLCKDLAHPIVGSVLPTFTMCTMVISHSIGEYLPLIGDILWLTAIILHIIFLISFLYHRVKSFEMHHMLPSWFVPPVGILVADLSFSGNLMLEPIANILLVFGMLNYAVMLPFMIYRLMFTHEIPDTSKPTMAILAAPASLSLAAYLTIADMPSPIIIALLFGIAVLMTVTIYLSFFKLLSLPFTPGYAAFTFPLVIGATALFKLALWMQSVHIDQQYIEQIYTLAIIELIIATIIVAYVSLEYIHKLLMQPQFR